jgi:hypothetical protein
LKLRINSSTIQKPFFFEWVKWGIKNLSFYTDFKNVNLTLVKSAPKKKFCPKNNFSGTGYTLHAHTVCGGKEGRKESSQKVLNK